MKLLIRVNWLSLLLAATVANAEMKVVSQGKATQILTDEYIVRSTTIDRDFIIEVSRPDATPPAQKTAVIYATDGGFGLVGPASRALMADGKIPKVHVVSIGYPNESGRHGGPRQVDLAHGRFELDGRVFEGAGATFEAFIMNEVRPFIEARYPVDPSRSVLFGHSMGGLFVANVMLGKPESFAGYLIGGVPVIGDPSLLQRAKAAAPRGNGRRVFIGYVPSDAKRLRSNEFAAPLTGRDSTFKVLEQTFEDEKHNSEILMLIAKGFRFLLPTDGSDRTEIKLKPAALERLLGTYSSRPEQAFVISRDGSRLFGTLKRGQREDRVELFTESETKAFARDEYLQIAFNPGADGKIASITVRLNDNDVTAPRIN